MIPLVSSQIPSNGEVATRWICHLADPLQSPVRKIAADLQLAETCRRDSNWTAAWMGGVIADLVRALPDDDPVRSLSAVIPGGPVRGNPPEPDKGGAWWPDGRPFRDSVPADPRVPAVYGSAFEPDQLPAASATWIAMGEGGWREARRAGEAMRDRWAALATEQTPTTGAANRLMLAGEGAIRWLLARRREHLLRLDEWPHASATRWADWLDAGAEPSDDEVESGLAARRLTSGAAAAAGLPGLSRLPRI